MEEKEEATAIVLYPAPGIGHVASMVELSTLLHRQFPNFSIHILLLPTADPSVTSYLHRHTANLTFHHLPLLSAPPPIRNISPAAAAFEFIRLNSDSVKNCIKKIRQEGSRVVKAVVVDFFCTSGLEIAAEMGIHAYYFFTSGAAALAAYLYFPTIDSSGVVNSSSFKNLSTTQLSIPGLPMVRATYMPEPILDRNDPAYDDILHFSLHFSKSNGIIVNTFEELEPIPIKAIANGSCLPNAPTPPIYYIGPIISHSNHNDTASRHECLTWLDQQPSKSVVFLCFGSRGSFFLAQVKEIADGLEQSGHRFLWVLKSPSSDEILPRGFLERTKGRGMVVGSWAPQMSVLGHDSVGGFVTHCGWNSVLEAVTEGVPLIAWPLYAEQFLNRVALVEDMKMAIGVEQRDEDGFVTGDEVARRVRELMESEIGSELRERSSKMREKAIAAWGECGSSKTALAYLVRTWS